MAIKRSKTFRATDAVFDALSQQAQKTGLSENAIINDALEQYLGVAGRYVNVNEFDKLVRAVKGMAKKIDNDAAA
jgi:predicted transcriptional regulator